MKCKKCDGDVYYHCHDEEWSKRPVEDNGKVDLSVPVKDHAYLDTLSEYGECDECRTIYKFDRIEEKITDEEIEDYPRY